MPRLGYLSLGPRSLRLIADGSLRRDLGYVEDQTIAIEWRFAPAGSEAAWAELAAELVRLPVDLIVAQQYRGVPIAKAATNTIPIVVVAAALPRAGWSLPGATRAATSRGVHLIASTPST
jgi:hypothetical protein